MRHACDVCVRVSGGGLVVYYVWLRCGEMPSYIFNCPALLVHFGKGFEARNAP